LQKWGVPDYVYKVEGSDPIWKGNMPLPRKLSKWCCATVQAGIFLLLCATFLT